MGLCPSEQNPSKPQNNCLWEWNASTPPPPNYWPILGGHREWAPFNYLLPSTTFISVPSLMPSTDLSSEKLSRVMLLKRNEKQVL